MPSPPVTASATAPDPDFDAILETCRHFLLSIATDELPPQLTAKGGASDIVQDTLAAAVRSRGQFRGTTVAELRAWLRGILFNELALFRRRYLETHGRDVAREQNLSALEATLVSPPGTPVDQLVRDERRRALSAALAELPEDHRRIVALRMEHGLGFREIGEQVGRSEEATRKLFTRSLDRLRGILATTG